MNPLAAEVNGPKIWTLVTVAAICSNTGGDIRCEFTLLVSDNDDNAAFVTTCTTKCDSKSIRDTLWPGGPLHHNLSAVNNCQADVTTQARDGIGLFSHSNIPPNSPCLRFLSEQFLCLLLSAVSLCLFLPSPLLRVQLSLNASNDYHYSAQKLFGCLVSP